MKKIGIITFHKVYNYGGILQAFALFKFLNKKYDVEFIDYMNPTLLNKYAHSLYSSKKSIKNNLKHFIQYYLLKKGQTKEKKINDFISSHYKKSNSQTDLKEYDILISGSDQLWNPTFSGGRIDEFYFLNFAQKTQKKIAYASSAGSFKFSKKELNRIQILLSDFHRISVREPQLKSQIAENFHKEIEVVLDPTFLLSKEDWSPYFQKIDRLPEKYILIYTFDNDETCFRLANELKNKLGFEIVLISSDIIKHKRVDIQLSGLGIGEFLWAFKNSQFIISNSFHGTAFAINFEINFYSVYKKNNPDRAKNILSKVDLLERLASADFEINFDRIDINFKKPSALLKNEVESSQNFLLNSIKS